MKVVPKHKPTAHASIREHRNRTIPGTYEFIEREAPFSAKRLTWTRIKRLTA
jgi:hypothetical protein